MIKKPNEKNDLPFFENEEKVNNKSKEISLDDHSEEPSTVTVSFEDEDLASNFASAQTKTSKDDGIDPNTPIDKLQSDISAHEASKSGKLEHKDLLKTAEFIINLADTALATAFNWFAKDTAIQAYSMPSANKKQLAEQLALILAKYQTSFKIEFMFFMSIIVMYAPLTIAAVKSRKERSVKKPKDPIKEKLGNETYYRHVPNVEKAPIVVEQVLDEVKLPIKRKRGTQRKVTI